MRVYLFYDILFIYGYISIKGYIFDIVFEMLFLCFKIISINVNEFRKWYFIINVIFNLLI